MEAWKMKDGEDNFGGPRWYVYLVHIDALTLLLEHWWRSRGVGGLTFYPEIPVQHTSSFCKTLSVLTRYVWMHQVNKTWEMLLRLKIPRCHFTLHRVWNIVVHNVVNSISGPLDFKIFFGGGGEVRPPQGLTPLVLVFNNLNKYSCQYEHPSKNLSYGPVCCLCMPLNMLSWLLFLFSSTSISCMNFINLPCIHLI